VEKEIVAVENISAFKENPTTLHGEDMRDAWRASQVLSYLLCRLQGVKLKTHLKHFPC
jgi:hypothetical protein